MLKYAQKLINYQISYNLVREKMRVEMEKKDFLHKQNQVNRLRRLGKRLLD